ncbi:MAG: type II toxin-antitoxin system VapB family antitoxin [Akkermansiaceae bacterium]
MRTTITIDDSLFESAADAAGESNASTLVAKALALLVSTEAKKRLLMLSGKAPSFSIPERANRTAPISLTAAEDPEQYNP